MNIFALTLGIAIVAYVIIRFRKTRLERTRWAYPLLLATFPLYYFVFAIYTKDLAALEKEIGVAVVFFVLAYLAYRSQGKPAALLVGLGCILHAVYDAYHDMLFVNAGTPSWWLEFCGSIDLILGIYLIYFAISETRKQESQNQQTTQTS